MSTTVTTKRICDRCKKELSSYLKISLTFGKPRRIRAICKRESGDGYLFTSYYELCRECEKDFEKFLKQEGKKQ